jgi:hypothetical protein
MNPTTAVLDCIYNVKAKGYEVSHLVVPRGAGD